MIGLGRRDRNEDDDSMTVRIALSRDDRLAFAFAGVMNACCGRVGESNSVPSSSIIRCSSASSSGLLLTCGSSDCI